MEGTEPAQSIAGSSAALSPFAVLLRQYRVTAGLTQEELAERSGVSVRAISDLERGVKLRPQRATIGLLADGLGLATEERSALDGAVPGRHPPSAPHSLDLPIGGFLGSVPDGPLIARSDEIERIREVVETVRGGAGRLLLLSGEPGVGKTRLAQEATLIGRANGMHIAAGRCYQPQQAVAFSPFLDIVPRLVIAGRSGLGIDPLLRWPQLAPIVPGALLTGQSATGEGDQQRLFWAVARLLEALAGTMPVVVALDDLHWADRSSLALLQHLTVQLRHVSVLLIATYRGIEVGRDHPLRPVLRDLHREHLAEEIAVGRLDQVGTGALIRSLCGDGPVATGFVDLVHRQTDGNAFFVQEVVRTLIERGEVVQEDETWARRAGGEIAIPETVAEAIEERVARLSTGTQDVLDEASVLGQTFGFEELAGMGNRTEVEVEEALDEAVRASVVRVGESDLYAFNHALTQHVLYRGLAPRRRRRLHRAAGRAIEQQSDRIREERAAELSWHFQQGGDEDQALPYAVRAGDWAESRYAHPEAERQYRVALQLAGGRGDGIREAGILEKLGGTLNSVGRYEDALQVLEQAAEIYRKANEIEPEARVTAQIGRVHADRGTSEEGIARIERMLTVLEGYEPSTGMAALYAALGTLYFAAGRSPREQLAVAERAADLARLFGNDSILAAAEVRRGVALSLIARGEESLAVLHDAIPLAEHVGDLVSLHRALAAISDMERMGGQFDRAKLYRERSLEVANRLGAPATIAFATATLGRLYYFAGDWDEAAALLERALAMAGSTGSWFSAYPAYHLGELRLAQGAWDEASGLLAQALTIGRRTQDLQARRYAERMLAELDLFEGRHETARRRLEPLLDRPGLEESQVTEMLPTLATAYEPAGDLSHAETAIEEAIRRAAAPGHTLTLASALLVRGRVTAAQGRWSVGEGDLVEAVRLAREMPYPYLEAQAHLEWGIMAGKTGEPETARERLEGALAIFRRLGARPYVERTEQALAALQ